MGIPEEVKHDLRSAFGHSFEDVCYKYLQMFIPGLLHARSLGETDIAGVDLFLRDDSGDLTLAIQCKGFERPFDDDQLRQCRLSIAKFKASGRRTRTYRLVLNGDIKDAAHREALSIELNDLVTAGVARKAKLMPLDKLGRWLGELARKWVGKALARRWVRLRDDFVSRMDAHFYLTDVPCRQDGGNQIEGGPQREIIRDVVRWNRGGNTKPPGRIFIVGEFGFGKTSLLLQLFEPLGDLADYRIFVPVTQFRSDAFSNEKDFVRSILGALLADEDISVDANVERLLREALTHILRSPDSSVLLLDGLDEHPYLYQPDAIGTLFNCLQQFQTVIVFTIRKEFWDERAGNFRAAFETARQYNRRTKVLHLEAWGQREIEAYVSASERVQEFRSDGFRRFREIIRAGAYENHYGDIPRRPLFLHMLAEDAESGALDVSNLALLYYNYFRRKLTRDQEQLDRKGGAGRLLVRPSQDLEARVYEILEVLTQVAGRTITVLSGAFGAAPFGAIPFGAGVVAQLLPEFGESLLGEILDARSISRTEIPAFIANSLLIPVGRREPGRMFYRFAHRSYQEWFAARHYRASRNSSGMPREVERFYKQMVAAGAAIP